MEILNLGGASDESAKLPSKKRLKVAKSAIGIGGLAALTGLGSTLAANISLNDGANSVEFGQGVAQTAACDEDGFTITPVSYYDADLSAFRLDYIEVSGLNLIPIGSDESLSSGSGADTTYTQYGDTTAVAAHPGQYYGNDNVWTNTCDQVVLDFKAYTDSLDYVGNTLDGYTALENSAPLPNTVSSPLMWAVNNDDVVNPIADNWQANSDIAIIFDATNDGSNYGTQNTLNNNYDYINFTLPTDTGGTGFVKASSFQFFTSWGHHYDELYGDDNSGYWHDPAAGAISKITVESMKYFPSDYDQAGNGTNGNGGYLGVNPN